MGKGSGAGTVVLSGGDVDGAGTVVLSPSGDLSNTSSPSESYEPAGVGPISNTSSPSESYSPARAAIAVCDGAGTVVLSGGKCQ